MQPLRRAYHTAQALTDAVARPPYVRNGHFYSPVNSPTDIARALSWGEDLPGVDLREADQAQLFSELIPLFEGVPQQRYRPDNGMYDSADALVYLGMIRRLQPARVIEVGSGFSTAMLLDTAERFLAGVDITCVEPYPDRLNALLRPKDEVRLIKSPVQDVPVETFMELKANDILFIDSTHVAKAGSDVLWLYLHVLPRLAEGVIVHVHDVFWPFEYPSNWLQEGRSWNEAYFLHAFLCQNSAWQLELFNSWLWNRRSDLVPAELKSQQPGAVWMRRV